MSKKIANGELRMANGKDDLQVDFPMLPTETEIYILPDGEIVVADLPVELSQLVTALHPTRQNHVKTSVKG